MNVYLITHIPTNRFYVGKANNPTKRWTTHCWMAKTGRKDQYLHRAMGKHGVEEFSFQVLENFSTEQDAYEAEVFWIGFLRSNIEGFNRESGGRGGQKRSPEFSARLAKRNSERQWSQESRAKLAAFQTGRRASEQTKAKMSAARKGKKHSLETRERLSRVLTGKKHFPSAETVAKRAAGRRVESK